MKEQIFKVISKAGANGIRLRDIGPEVGVWHVKCLEHVLELEQEGRVCHKTIGIGWEAFVKYYAT